MLVGLLMVTQAIPKIDNSATTRVQRNIELLSELAAWLRLKRDISGYYLKEAFLAFTGIPFTNCHLRLRKPPSRATILTILDLKHSTAVFTTQVKIAAAGAFRAPYGKILYVRPGFFRHILLVVLLRCHCDL